MARRAMTIVASSAELSTRWIWLGAASGINYGGKRCWRWLATTGGLLKSEKHAQREGFWAAHVLRPRGAQSQGVAPERRLFPIQQTTVTEACVIARARSAQRRVCRSAFQSQRISQASVTVLC